LIQILIFLLVICKKSRASSANIVSIKKNKTENKTHKRCSSYASFILSLYYNLYTCLFIVVSIKSRIGKLYNIIRIYSIINIRYQLILLKQIQNLYKLFILSSCSTVCSLVSILLQLTTIIDTNNCTKDKTNLFLLIESFAIKSILIIYLLFITESIVFCFCFIAFFLQIFIVKFEKQNINSESEFIDVVEIIDFAATSVLLNNLYNTELAGNTKKLIIIDNTLSAFEYKISVFFVLLISFLIRYML